MCHHEKEGLEGGAGAGEGGQFLLGHRACEEPLGNRPVLLVPILLHLFVQIIYCFLFYWTP